jgi:hypothetical protein
LRAFENRVLRRIFLDLRGMKWQEDGKNCIMRSCMIYTVCQFCEDYQTEERELGGIYGPRGGDEKYIQNVY